MCNLAALVCILFELWSIKITHFFTILCVTLWAPQPPAPQPPAPRGTYLYTLCRNFLIMHPNDLGLFFFQRRDIKLQIDTKVNVIGLVEVLKKCQTHKKKVNHETTPPYLRDQFTTCNHKLHCWLANWCTAIRKSTPMWTFPSHNASNLSLFLPTMHHFGDQQYTLWGTVRYCRPGILLEYPTILILIIIIIPNPNLNRNPNPKPNSNPNKG